MESTGDGSDLTDPVGNGLPDCEFVGIGVPWPVFGNSLFLEPAKFAALGRQGLLHARSSLDGDYGHGAASSIGTSGSRGAPGWMGAGLSLDGVILRRSEYQRQSEWV